MANNPFDRMILNPREKPLSRDINQAQSQLDYALRELARHVLAKRASNSSLGELAADGFLANGFRAEPAGAPDMTVTLKAGMAFMSAAADVPSAIDGIVGLDDLSTYKPIMLMADLVFNVPTAPGAGNARIDIIEVKPNRLVGNPNARLILDPDTGAFNPDTVNKTLAFVVDGSTGYVISPALSTVAVSYKQGVEAAAGAEVEPAVTTGYMQVARINVAESVTTISAGDIADRRKLLFPGGVAHFSATWNVTNPGGGNVYTLLSLSAPPGIGLTMANLSLKAAGTFYVTGGQIANATILMNVSHQNGLSFTDRFTIGIPRWQGDVIGTADAAVTAALAAATPSVLVGVGSKYAVAAAISRFVTNTGASNDSDASLDPAHIRVEGALSY